MSAARVQIACSFLAPSGRLLRTEHYGTERRRREFRVSSGSKTYLLSVSCKYPLTDRCGWVASTLRASVVSITLPQAQYSINPAIDCIRGSVEERFWARSASSGTCCTAMGLPVCCCVILLISHDLH